MVAKSLEELEQEALEKETEKLTEPEDLKDVDIGLPDGDILTIVADERFQIAGSFQRLNIRLATIKASIVANQSVGNSKAAKQFEDQEVDVSVQMQHCLRGIKTIDKEYPKAKAEMRKMIEQRRERVQR